MVRNDQSLEMPGSFQDAAKAGEKVLDIVERLISHGGKVLEKYQWYRRRKAAYALNVLRFKEGGFINIVRRIAGGQFTESDVAAINAMLEKSEPQVAESIDHLRRLAHLIREEIGMWPAIQLEHILDSD